MSPRKSHQGREESNATPSCPCCSRWDNMQRWRHEKLFAFLDDLTVVCRPDRVRDVMNIISQELQAHGHISVHHGKTLLCGVFMGPHQHICGKTMGVTQEIPQGREWSKATLSCPCCSRWDNMQRWRRSNVVCGTVRSRSAVATPRQRCCPICRCPEVVWGSVALPGPTGQIAADCVHMIKQRHPEVAEIMLTGIDQEVAPCFQAVRDPAGTLREAGLATPTWRVLADTPPVRDLQAKPAEPLIWVATPRSELSGGAVPDHIVADLQRRTQNFVAVASGIGSVAVSDQPLPPSPFVPTHLPMWPPS